MNSNRRIFNSLLTALINGHRMLIERGFERVYHEMEEDDDEDEFSESTIELGGPIKEKNIDYESVPRMQFLEHLALAEVYNEKDGDFRRNFFLTSIYVKDTSEPVTLLYLVVAGDSPINKATHDSHKNEIVKDLHKVRNFITQDKNVNRYHQRRINAILITKTSVTSTTSFMDVAPSSIPRSEWTNTAPKFQIRVMAFSRMKIYLPNHVLVPRVDRIIKDENDLEFLRQHFVEDIVDKDATLDELLPLIRMNDPMVQWYDMQVGDVVRVIRNNIDGPSEYYRYVSPLLF